MVRNIGSAFLALALSTSAAVAFAKRAAPKPVPPVVANGTRFTAPHNSMGFVVATDIRNGDTLWSRQIYVVKINRAVEGDVQACFITSLKLNSTKLIVTNESGNEYALDLRTLDVRPLKGSIVVQLFPN
jgi:hypothetical protein